MLVSEGPTERNAGYALLAMAGLVVIVAGSATYIPG